jgi:hypothetical protein
VNRVALAALLVAGACSGTYDVPRDGPGLDAPDDMAREEFNRMVRALVDAECAECHTTGNEAAPIYGDTYDSLSAYKDGYLFSCLPEQSPIYTKNVHIPGVDWLPSSEPIVFAFLQTWSRVHPRCQDLPPRPRSGPFVPVLDQPNTVSLAELGPGLGGATLTFSAQRVTGGLYLSSVRANAGNGGLEVVAPLFEACLAGSSVPDPGNAFTQVAITVEPNTSVTLDPGALAIAGWQTGEPLGISFATLTPKGVGGAPIDNGGACGAAGPPPADAGVTDALP